MSNWESNVRKVTPYTPGEQPRDEHMIKLNTNENPYMASEFAVRALGAVTADELRLYPDPAASDLVNALAAHYGVRPEQVFVGVGSDDVIAMAFQTFFNSEKPVLFPDITYSFYDVWAEAFRIPYRTVPLTEDFEIIPEDFCVENGGIIFPNPNAPTGIALQPEAVRKIVSSNPDSVVIVDEAYVDFGAESALPLISEFENLLVVQTFSKSRSMAGMRIGYAFGSEKLIKYLSDFKYSFNSYTMSRAAIAAGTAVLADEDHFRKSVADIIETRERAAEAFRSRGFDVCDSKANFLFVRHKSAYAGDLFRALRERSIYVRYFSRPGIDNYLRVTIGTPEQMDALFEALDEII